VDILALDAKGEPQQSVVIETFDGFLYELKLGEEEAGTVPVFISVSGSFAKDAHTGEPTKSRRTRRVWMQNFRRS